ncbi:MAG: DinB family protein [Bryobacteraceae bacterium]
MATLTSEERAHLTERLEQSRDLFLRSIDGLTPAQWAFKPSEEEWSVGECSDHVLFIENLTFGLVTEKIFRRPAEPEKAAEVAGKERKLERAVPDRSTKVKMPIKAEPTGCAECPETLAAAFQDARQKTLDYVVTTDKPLHHHFAPHMIFKDLDGAQWLLMMALHAERHVHQIEEVKANPAYPSA